MRLEDDKHSLALCCCSGKKASEGDFESFFDLPDLRVGDVFTSLLDLDRKHGVPGVAYCANFEKKTLLSSCVTARGKEAKSK